ncbi:MAG TPA: GHKL domain-containing protein [Clostridia bacterium]|nr:GHKL domain-containing protein [Clostridia bacterium]
MLDKNAIYIVSIILLQAMLLIMLFQSLYFSTEIGYWAEAVLSVMPYISYIVMVLTIITVVTVSKLSLMARKQQELEIKELENRHIKQMNEALRGQRHDFNNHLQVIYMLAQANRLPQVLAYLKDLTEEAAGVNNILGMQCPTVGALISSKLGLAQKSGVELEYDVQGDIEGGRVRPLHLCRILGNLLDNAIEAVRELKLPSPKVELKAYCDAGKLYISVKNPGQIHPSVMDRLFIPGTSTKKGKNRGMGLNIVKGIVDMYNGRIEVDSNPERGVRVLVELPR